MHAEQENNLTHTK